MNNEKCCDAKGRSQLPHRLQLHDRKAQYAEDEELLSVAVENVMAVLRDKFVQGAIRLFSGADEFWEFKLDYDQMNIGQDLERLVPAELERLRNEQKRDCVPPYPLD